MIKIFQSRAVGTEVYISFWNLSALVIQVKWLYAQEGSFLHGALWKCSWIWNIYLFHIGKYYSFLEKEGA